MLLFVWCVCVCARTCICTPIPQHVQSMVKGQLSSFGSLFQPHGPWVRPQVISLGGRRLYLLNHLASLHLPFVESGSRSVILANLELAMLSRLKFKSHRYTCLYIPSAGITNASNKPNSTENSFTSYQGCFV